MINPVLPRHDLALVREAATCYGYDMGAGEKVHEKAIKVAPSSWRTFAWRVLGPADELENGARQALVKAHGR